MQRLAWHRCIRMGYYFRFVRFFRAQPSRIFADAPEPEHIKPVTRNDTLGGQFGFLQ
jgi:hypothetical protein